MFNKDEFIEKSLKANESSLQNAKISDLVNPESPVYKKEILEEIEHPEKERPKFDTDGLPELAGIRTYRADISDASQNQNLSLAKIVEENQNKKHETEEESAISKLNKKTLLTGSLIGFFILILLGSSFYFLKKETPVIVQNNQNISIERPTIIRKEESVEFDIENKSSEDIKNLFKEEKNRIPKDAIIREIVLTRNVMDTTLPISSFDFLNKIDANPSETLKRTLSNYFFSGIFFNGEANPFIILVANSYDFAFKGLLEWERDLPEDLGFLFKKEGQRELDFKVKDKVISNQDTRAFEDEEGNILFFYSIIKNHVIVFAQNTETLDKIIDELRVRAISN